MKMIEPSLTIPDNNSETINNPRNKGMIFILVLFIFLFILAIILVSLKSNQIKDFLSNSKRFSDFSTMQVSDGFHKVSIPSGTHWEIAYEADHEVLFQGKVMFNYPIREKGFEIMTQDILVTSGDYSNPDLVWTDVSNHHFSYRYLTDRPVFGTINLLHTLPVDEGIHQQLKAVKPGDDVIIKGWEIYNLKSWDVKGKFLGTWQDAGCNTTLITQVIINPFH